MLKKQDKASLVEQDDQERDSVYDFLYYDHRRIASFLSQFHSSGYLKQITENDSEGESTNRSSKTGVDANVAVLKSQIGSERSNVFSRQSSSERLYDPLWSNALEFLDYLDERNMIHRNAQEANIGQFILVSGSLQLIDFGLLQKTWKLPSAKSVFKKQGSAKQSVPIEFMIDMLSIFPHTVQGRLKGDKDTWCGLNEEFLVVSPSDLMLKHGISLSGQWNILGVLDARPYERHAVPAATFEDSVEAGQKLLEALVPIVQTMLGRPQLCYGITPLLIFREVTG